MMQSAVIGYGYWGSNLARVLSQSGHFDLRCICDGSPEALARARKVHPHVTLVDDVRAIPDTVEVCAVVTPGGTHFELALEMLRRGCHVLVTKPFARTEAEADEMLRVAEERGLTCFADHTFVFNPAVRKLKEMVSRVGEPYFVVSQRMNLGLYQADVNVTYDLLPHDLSILCYLFDDEVRTCTKNELRAAGLPQEDVAHVSMQLHGGLSAHCSVSWLSPYKIRQFIVVGSEGMLSYDDNAVSEKIKFFDRKIRWEGEGGPRSMDEFTARISYRSGDLFSPAVPNREALAVEMDEFSSAISDSAVRAYYNDLTRRTMRSLWKVIRC